MSIPCAFPVADVASSVFGPCQAVIQHPERRTAFEAIASRQSGVYIVRLRQDDRVDHAVVVDANRGVIIDSEESTAIVLTADNLAKCGGASATKLRVKEVREVRA